MNWQWHPITKTEFSQQQSNRSTYLQSSRYGDFREKVGETILYVGGDFNKKLSARALVQKITTRWRTFLHVPHGPIFDEEVYKDPVALTKAWKEFLAFYRQLGQTEKVDFVRVSSLLPDTDEFRGITQSAGYRPATVHLMNPEHTWVLDLSPDEEVLLQNMRKSTRYEVRRVAKTGITIQQNNDDQSLQTFWDLHQKTVQRQGFRPFPLSHTRWQRDLWQDDFQVFTASLDGQPWSSAIILFDHHQAYYHQGSSLPHKLPVAHAPLWEAIKFAKQRGCQQFNFWGVVGDEDKKHPWWGLSRFKKGFGGAEQKFLHCHDFPLTAKYRLVCLLERWRRWRRGY